MSTFVTKHFEQLPDHDSGCPTCGAELQEVRQEGVTVRRCPWATSSSPAPEDGVRRCRWPRARHLVEASANPYDEQPVTDKKRASRHDSDPVELGAHRS